MSEIERGGPQDRVPWPGAGDTTGRRPWRLSETTRWIFILVVSALLVISIAGLFSRASSFVLSLAFALFLSFALEPAVNFLSRRGWSRGLATILAFVAVVVATGVLIVLMIPPVINAVVALVVAVQDALPRLAEFTNERFGFSLYSSEVQSQLSQYGADIAQAAGNLFLGLFGFGAGLLGALFQVMTIGLLTFYLVAYGPQFRRFVCSFLPPQQQRDVLWVWDTAIDKTGAFFYSRLLMAVLNGAGLFVVLSILGVPYPVALAAFTALVSAFIPTIGTYIGGAAPVLVALSVNWRDGLIVLGYIVVYQQIENMLIGPKLSGRTMQLNEGVTFGAAILGAYLGGPLMAFLAIPFAAVLQAVLTSFGTRYEVVESELVSDEGEEDSSTGPSSRSAFRDRFRRRTPPGDGPPPGDADPGHPGGSGTGGPGGPSAGGAGAGGPDTDEDQ